MYTDFIQCYFHNLEPTDQKGFIMTYRALSTSPIRLASEATSR
jgi:hypothetical protein